MKAQDQAKQYFENNPSVKELFSTSDGTLFHKRYDAAIHSKTLEDQDIEDHVNPKQSVKEVIVPKNFLDNSIPVIVGWMDNLTKDEIFSYLEAEKQGKKRVSLIKAFEEQLSKSDVLGEGVEDTGDSDLTVTELFTGDVGNSNIENNVNKVE